MSSELIGKLRRLAERRRDHLVDLQETGRWKHYYSESEFAARKLDAVELVDTWDQMAASPAE
jgi:uncharacterized repeat protein (TIGR03809 family)